VAWSGWIVETHGIVNSEVSLIGTNGGKYENVPGRLLSVAHWRFRVRTEIARRLRSSD